MSRFVLRNETSMPSHQRQIQNGVRASPVAAPNLDRPTAGHEARELDQWIIASLFWAATKVDDAATGTLST